MLAAEANVSKSNLSSRSYNVKRYRVFLFDFDSRAIGLDKPVPETYEPEFRERLLADRERILENLKLELGEENFDAKLENFTDLGPKRFSVVGFHNQFYDQSRRSFVIGAYYPALVGSCALGERILNHLVLALREDFKDTAAYKRVYRKNSFDDWDLAIDTLADWGVLTPGAVGAFRELKCKRHEAVHFRPEIDSNARALALEAISCLGIVIQRQFGAAGDLPWFMDDTPGEIYIRGDWANRPFINKIYVQSCGLVGPWHEVESVVPKWVIRDNFAYEDRDISDEEFVSLRKSGPPAS